jgi:hypothetical protein
MNLVTIEPYIPPTWVLLLIHLPAAGLSAVLVWIAIEIPSSFFHFNPTDYSFVLAPFCGAVGAFLIARLTPSLIRSGRWLFIPFIAVLLPGIVTLCREIVLSVPTTRLDQLTNWSNDRDDDLYVTSAYLSYSLTMFLLARRNTS